MTIYDTTNDYIYKKSFIMRSYTLFQEYIWLVNIIHRAHGITFGEINRKWLETEMSEGISLARSTFNRHKDAIQDMFGIYIECDKKNGFKYYIGNEEVLDEDSIQNWMLSTLSVNNILSESKSVHDRILLESIPSDGENLHRFIDAMKRGLRIIVRYRRYMTDFLKQQRQQQLMPPKRRMKKVGFSHSTIQVTLHS